MNLLCWNCRGLGNPWSVRQLRRWSSFYAPDIVFVSETMINKNDVEALKIVWVFIMLLVLLVEVGQVVCAYTGRRKFCFL